jgi:hypothetical protein
MRPGRLRFQPRSLFGSLLVAIAMTLPAAGTAVAQDATPVSQASPFTPPAGCTVYADGLLNPRYMTFDRSGNLYISEAGDGGSEAIMAPAGQATPGAGDATPQAGGEAVSMYGTTGRVTKIAPDGTRSVVASDLPSYTFGSEIVGPAGIAFDRGTIYLAIGGPGPATALVPEKYLQNSVVAIDPSNGDVKTIADIGAYERSHNPDPNAVDSNLYGLAAAGGGILYVADAGGNTVYRIDSSNGDFKPLAVIPGVPMEGMKNPNRGGKAEIDPVPTDVIPAPGGGIYVGELTGGPFPQGAASILKINDDGSIETTASGLTMVTGLARASNGQIFAVQLSENFVAQPPAPGSVVKIGAFNKPYPAVGGLPAPNDLRFDSQGNMYVIVMTTSPQGAPPSGMVIKCEPLAISPATPAAGGERATPVSVLGGQAAAELTRLDV